MTEKLDFTLLWGIDYIKSKRTLHYCQDGKDIPMVSSVTYGFRGKNVLFSKFLAQKEYSKDDILGLKPYFAFGLGFEIPTSSFGTSKMQTTFNNDKAKYKEAKQKAKQFGGNIVITLKNKNHDKPLQSDIIRSMEAGGLKVYKLLSGSEITEFSVFSNGGHYKQISDALTSDSNAIVFATMEIHLLKPIQKPWFRSAYKEYFGNFCVAVVVFLAIIFLLF